MKKYSLLLSSLAHRLILAVAMLAILWGVYFWATSGDTALPDEPVAEVSAP